MRNHMSAIPLVLLFVPFPVAGTLGQMIWYVDDDAPPGGDGATWNTAYMHLQDALKVATDGDEIRVAKGVYRPDQDESGSAVPGDRSASFYLSGSVRLIGGFNGLSDPDNPNERGSRSKLTGDLLGNDLHGTPVRGTEDNSYHVVRGSGGPDALLDGFYIVAGDDSRRRRVGLAALGHSFALAVLIGGGSAIRAYPLSQQAVRHPRPERR